MSVTPGPWKLILSPDPATNSVVVGTDGYRVHELDSGYGLTADEDLIEKANGRLIAAAPDLLDALKLALEQIEPAPKPKLIRTPEFALRMVRAAITKAEGRS
jgi:hypothetical protein